MEPRLACPSCESLNFKDPSVRKAGSYVFDFLSLTVDMYHADGPSSMLLLVMLDQPRLECPSVRAETVFAQCLEPEPFMY